VASSAAIWRKLRASPPDRHPKPDVKRAIARLSVLGRLDLQGSRYTLPAAKAEQG
jgi:hypothetical protein